MSANDAQTILKIANMGFHPTLNKKIFTDEPNMFANDAQTPIKISNMGFHPTLNNRLFRHEIYRG